MKINWGTGIVIAFVLFIGFIMFFVVRTLTDESLEHELVTDDYYKKELQFQGELNAEQRARDLGITLKVWRSEDGLMVKFPEDQDPKLIQGKVFLYRPSDKQFDFEVAISLSDPHLLIPKDRLLDGRWNIVADWTYGKIAYRVKQSINY